MSKIFLKTINDDDDDSVISLELKAGDNIPCTLTDKK